MPRRSLLTDTERNRLLAIPENEAELIRLATLSEQDMALINQHRGESNRLGFAILLCYLRSLGYVLEEDAIPDAALLKRVSKSLKISPGQWQLFGTRPQTRWDYLQELYAYLGISPYSSEANQKIIAYLTELATQTDKGLALAEAMVAWLRQHHIIVPTISVIERVCAEALTLGTRQVYATLNNALAPLHRLKLDALLVIPEGHNLTTMAWLRQPPGKSNAKHVLLHIERLKTIEALALPDGSDRLIHQNRLLKLAREGGQMVPKDLAKFEPTRRYATLVAIAIEARATLIDEIVNLHDRIIGKIFSKAKRIQADQLQLSGKAIHAKLRQYLDIGQALLVAKQTGNDAFQAIEQILPWDEFEISLHETELLAKRDTFDSLHLISDSYTTLRKYTPEMLAVLTLKAAPAARGIMAAIDMLRQMNERQTRKVPDDAPTDFIKPRWQKLVITDVGIDRRYYELCALSELRGALRSGDIWVQGSRQFKDFEDYLLSNERFKTLQKEGALPLAIQPDCERYLAQRLALLTEQLATVNRLALAEQLPDATITEHGLRVTPLDKAVPEEAERLIVQASGLLPHLKITELLLEVDEWTGFTRHFTHMKNDSEAKDKHLLLTAILADGINLGLSKMAESCPGTTYSKLAWLQAWHIRDETYAPALAELVNAQTQRPFANNWGDGTSSSSDGQNFRAGGRGQAAGQVNLKYGQEPGIQLYTHVSDQYSPYHVQVISAGVRDSTHVLDGLLYHESDLRIEEHYTDTAGFTDHVFALMHLLGFRFAPRIRDLNDKRLYITGEADDYPALASMLGSKKINTKLIQTHWDEILRLATSIKQGTVTASLMLRKLGSYPRQNGLALALRELGQIERTLFMLEWMQDVDLRRRVQVGLNKGEARNALARAVFFNRLGEVRDRSYEQQRYRASGLNLITAAVVLWNTTYLERAIQSMKSHGQTIDENLLSHLSPLGWEHINLTGDYVWRNSKRLGDDKFRPLRRIGEE
jgi:TnpA family transposase